MSRKFKIFDHFENVTGGPASDKDFVVPAGESIIIMGFDFSGPGGQSFMEVILDPTGTPLSLAASRGDKFVNVPPGALFIEGPATIRSQLTKIGGGAEKMGVHIYYEEV